MNSNKLATYREWLARRSVYFVYLQHNGLQTTELTSSAMRLDWDRRKQVVYVESIIEIEMFLFVSKYKRQHSQQRKEVIIYDECALKNRYVCM